MRSDGEGEPQAPEPTDGQRRRLHPVSILFILFAQARALLVPGLFVLFAARRADDPAVWAMVLIVPYAAAAVARYFFFRYAYRAEELVIESGIVFRKRRHVPYGRIHNIAAAENPLHRLFGVAEVRVETAGGEEPEARIRVLSHDALEEMRRRVAAGKARGGAAAPASAPVLPGEAEASAEVATTAAVEASAARELVRLGPRDLILYGLIDNRGMVVAGALVGLGWQLGLFDEPGAETRRSWEWWQAWREIPEAGMKLLWDSIGSGSSVLRIALGAALAVLAFLIVVRLLSLGWAFYKLWGFRLRLSGRELASESGLWTRVSTALPLHRVQTVTVSETPLHRLFGRIEVSAESAGGRTGSQEGGGGERERQRLAPILRREALPALLAEVLPGLDLDAVDWQPVDPRGERRMRRRGTVWAALAGVVAATGARLAGVSAWWGLAAFLPLAALAAWTARRSIRYMAWAVTPDAVLYRSGALWRHLTAARDSKIQAAGLTESPFDRRYRMATLRLDTAGATATSHRLHVPFLLRTQARDLLDRLATRAATTTFRW